MKRRSGLRWAFAAMVMCLFAVPAMVSAQTSEVRPIINQPVNEAKLTVLKGNTYPLAQPKYDQGAAPANLPMDSMFLVLRRSPEQDAALLKLIADQQDKSSPSYHHWLTPEQFGQQFGLADQDIAVISAWLQSHGFHIDQVSKGRTIIQFSGTAAQVQQTFHTAIRKFVVKGEEHWANTNDPSIPVALLPAVAGVAQLHNFLKQSYLHNMGLVTRSQVTGEVTPKAFVAGRTNPAFTYAGGCDPTSGNCFAVGPSDFATIYNVQPLWNAGTDGTGQTIAIVGRSNINIQDTADFRSIFGMPVNNPIVTIVNTDPGLVPGDETEANVDVQWSGAVAKGATIMFFPASTTNTMDGVDISAQFIVDLTPPPPVMSESFGQCEFNIGDAGNTMLNARWMQAATEGITVFVSTGDSGSAGCDFFQGVTPEAAMGGLAVSGVSSTPFNVAVGGTDFNDALNPSQFWSSTNNGTTQASALSYIPEVPWNSTCANSLLVNFGFSADAETNCNNSNLAGFVQTTGGSGGASSCITTNGGVCTAGYAKPVWQVGLGVPADGVRDVPDVSLFAGNGFFDSFYIICEADISADNTCNLNSPFADFVALGGTSVSTPAFAGIMGLVNQKAGATQGMINPALYTMFATQVAAGTNCNSNGATLPDSTCVFNDVTAGGNQMPCAMNSPNCTIQTQGDTIGVLPSFNATAGYDQATGLGSVNALNFVNNFAPGVTTVTVLPASLTFAAQAQGTASASQPVTVMNTGTSAFTLTGITFTGTNPTDYTETDNCATVAVASSCTINVVFTPGAVGASAGTMNITDNATGSPQLVTLTGTGVPNTTVTLAPTALTFPSTVVGSTSAAQTVLVTNAGPGTFTVTTVTFTGTNPTDYAQTNDCTAIAAAGTCTITVTFSPHANGPSTANMCVNDNATGSPQMVTLTGTGLGPTVSLSAANLDFSGTPVPVGTATAALPVVVTNTGGATLNVTSVTFTGTNPADYTETDTCVGVAVAAGGTCTINVTFTPRTAGGGASSASLNLTDNAPASPQLVALTGVGEDFTIAATPGTTAVTAGQSSTYTITVTPTQAVGFGSAVNLSCTGAPAGDTCTVSPTSVTPNTAAVTATVTVTTAAVTALAKGGSSTFFPGFHAPTALGGVLWLLAFIFSAAMVRPRMTRRLRFGFGVATFLVLSCAGCGSSKAPPTPVTSTLTLTGACPVGTLSHSTTVTITVTP